MSSPYQNAVKKMDLVFSKFIRLRDTPDGYGKCCSCGKMTLYGNLDAGHFINRRKMSVRWREDNVHAQCRSCNRFQEGNAAGYALFMFEKYSKQHIEFLQALSEESAQFTITEIDLMIKDYRAKIRQMYKERAA